METGNYTRGPWHICQTTSGRIDPIIRESGGFAVAQAVKPANSRAAHIDATANARLIAAAPDLLQACRALLEMARPSDGAPDSRKAVIQARAAIAAATESGQ